MPIQSGAFSWVSPFVILVLCTGLMQGFIIMGLFASTLSPLIGSVYGGLWQLGSLVIGVATLAGLMQALRWAWDPFVAPFIGRKVDQLATMLPVLLIPLIGGAGLLVLLALTEQVLLLLVFIICFQGLATVCAITSFTLATKSAGRSDKVKMMTAHTVVVDVGSALGPLVSFLLLMYYLLSFSTH